MWTHESMADLRAWLECTGWNVLTDSCQDVNEATVVVTDYIPFCEEMIDNSNKKNQTAPKQ